ncbi:glycosyltransferase family 2 protein [Paracoccus pacificus]|uniref:Glycosyltransferase family 2 protein n=1 Tax=Paracoccus pacificus TaxID=1463598 RepID=A0ABW4RC57_9RHOB
MPEIAPIQTAPTQTRSLQQALNDRTLAGLKGPVAVILIEDDSAVEATLNHHLNCGFRSVLALSARPLAPMPALEDPRVLNLNCDTTRRGATTEIMNPIIAALPAGTWVYYCYNAEFLFYPFSETRSVGELLAFHTEERRDAMLAYVIDLYAADLSQNPDAVNLPQAMFDAKGYYALGRQSADGAYLERQQDFLGGLRWRFEEHLPPDRRRIDRIALFRADKGLTLLPDHRFNIEEMNTYACPWHHNLTAAIASFRVAKALLRNPGSRWQIDSFVWRHSHPFEWNAQQLMDNGLMEPGQWF